MNSLINWDPFRELTDFASLLRSPGVKSELARAGTGDWAPAVDIAEDDESYIISADLPEVKKEDVNVSVENGYLTISGERRHESEDEDSNKKFHRVERSYGSYMRRFGVPDHVDAENIKASFQDGVLQVTLPKIEIEEKPGKIDVDID